MSVLPIKTRIRGPASTVGQSRRLPELILLRARLTLLANFAVLANLV